ncbi:MAG: hypothetical protein ACEQSK_11705 [Sphingomonadaceae bacterium]
MRRRLYFMLPSLSSTRTMLDELLLARIEVSHVRFMAREGALPSDLPGAGVLQRTDVVHGVQLGVVIGAIAGLCAGIALAMFPLDGFELRGIAIVLATLGGALFGGWASGMNAAAVPNSRLRQFASRIEQGQVLMIVDVPAGRVLEIEQMVARRHPDISFGGSEPPLLAFP